MYYSDWEFDIWHSQGFSYTFLIRLRIFTIFMEYLKIPRTQIIPENIKSGLFLISSGQKQISAYI